MCAFMRVCCTGVRTRVQVVRLVELLDEAKNRIGATVKERRWVGGVGGAGGGAGSGAGVV